MGFPAETRSPSANAAWSGCVVHSPGFLGAFELLTADKIFPRPQPEFSVIHIAQPSTRLEEEDSS
jgi:hypothetical protein